MNRTKIFRTLFRVGQFVPMALLIYNGFQNNLGAQPAEKVNHELGLYTLILLIINLYIGAIRDLFGKLPTALTWLNGERRFLGVTTFFYALFHVLFYYVKEGNISEAFQQIFTTTYLIFGLLAFLIIVAMGLTSNNLSVRKLGGKKWKRLHRLVYLALWLLAGHLFLIEKRDREEFVYYLVPIALLEIIRLGKYLKKRAKGILA